VNSTLLCAGSTVQVPEVRGRVEVVVLMGDSVAFRGVDDNCVKVDAVDVSNSCQD
jgi:hypothetical protein